MSQPQIVKSEKFDASKFEYQEPKILSHGGQAIYLQYEGKPLILQTPKMSMPWGMGKYDGDVPKFSVDLSFKGMDNSPSLESFYNAHDMIILLVNKLPFQQLFLQLVHYFHYFLSDGNQLNQEQPA